MNENELELMFFHCLENNCPLPIKKTRSLCKLVVKGLSSLPERFIKLPESSMIFYSYVKDKNKDIDINDCETYLAWRIWHFKLGEIDRRVINPVCKAKAHLIATKALLELHKSASRIKKAIELSVNVLDTSKNDGELFSKLTEIKELVSIQADKALQVYDNLLISHAQVISEVNLMVGEKIKQQNLLGESNGN